MEQYYQKLLKVLNDFNFLQDVDIFKTEYLKIYKSKFLPRFHQELFIKKISNYVTATYNKPKNIYDIEEQNIIK